MTDKELTSHCYAFAEILEEKLPGSRSLTIIFQGDDIKIIAKAIPEDFRDAILALESFLAHQEIKNENTTVH